MSGVIKVTDGSNVILRNITAVGFDKAVSIENSSLDISNSNLFNNRIGLELINSPSIINNTNFSNNGIDIFSERTPIQLIDSIVQNIFIDGINQIIRTQPVSINFGSVESSVV